MSLLELMRLLTWSMSSSSSSPRMVLSPPKLWIIVGSHGTIWGTGVPPPTTLFKLSTRDSIHHKFSACSREIGKWNGISSFCNIQCSIANLNTCRCLQAPSWVWKSGQLHAASPFQLQWRSYSKKWCFTPGTWLAVQVAVYPSPLECENLILPIDMISFAAVSQLLWSTHQHSGAFLLVFLSFTSVLWASTRSLPPCLFMKSEGQPAVVISLSLSVLKYIWKYLCDEQMD